MRRTIAFLLCAAVIGCQGGSEIPLVEFPKGAPAPPPEAKSAKSPEGANTSKPDPSTNPR